MVGCATVLMDLAGAAQMGGSGMDGDPRNWLRALETGPAFWLAMFAASAFGTNLGDLWTGRLGLPGLAGFGSLVVVSALAIWGDRRMGLRTEFAYWVAIVVLRAVATNAADFLTEALHLGFVPVALGLAAVALAMGSRTRAGPVGRRGASPVIGGWYWTAMFVAGVFGTVAGDLMNRTVGVLASTAALTVLLVLVLLVRARWLPGSLLSYWVAVLAERAAGTPVGDGLASRHGVGLGLPIATACTAALFAAALFWRERGRRLAMTAVGLEAAR